MPRAARVILRTSVKSPDRRRPLRPSLRKAKEQVIARLNLASDPFRNRALPWTIAVAVSLVSLAVLVLILAQYREVSAETAESEREVQEMRAQRSELEQALTALRRFATDKIDAAAIDRNADIPAEVIAGLGVVKVDLAVFVLRRRPGFPAIRPVENEGISLPVQCGFVAFQLIAMIPFIASISGCRSEPAMRDASGKL